MANFPYYDPRELLGFDTAPSGAPRQVVKNVPGASGKTTTKTPRKATAVTTKTPRLPVTQLKQEPPMYLRMPSPMGKYSPGTPGGFMEALNGPPEMVALGLPQLDWFSEAPLSNMVNTPINAAGAPINAAGSPPPNFLSTLWDKTKALGKDFFPQVDKTSGKLTSFGWGMPVMQGLATLNSLYESRKQRKLAEDQLDFSKEAFYTNLANQRKLTNMEMENAHNRRLSAGTTTEPLVDYMKRYGV